VPYLSASAVVIQTQYSLYVLSSKALKSSWQISTNGIIRRFMEAEKERVFESIRGRSSVYMAIN